MLKLKLQYFGQLMRRVDSLEKTLTMGRTEGRRRRGQQRMRWLDGISDSMDMSLSKLKDGDGQGSLACCVHGFTSSVAVKSCLTLCNPVDCSPPGSSIHGIFQATMLEWVAISFSRGSSQPRDGTRVSRITVRLYCLTHHGSRVEQN